MSTPTPPKPPGKPAAARPVPPKAVAAKPATVRSAAPATKDPLIGTTLGRCRLEARIGEGRTSVVYRAHNAATEGTVAVKVLSPSARANAEIVQKFQTEARTLAKIDHENVLRIYDVGTQGEEQFLVMELLDGEEILEIVLREGRMEPMDALRVTRQAAAGLAAAHARHIIHRDVKPQNLVLLEDGTVKVVDFGLAADVDAESQRVGTPHYMAPETCEKGVSETASDVYSLGITLYHLVVGQPPYAGRTVKEILQAHVEGAPLYPERKATKLGKDAAELLRRMTKRDPLLRPSAPEVVAELDRIGGEALKAKDTLKLRRSRFRGRAAARSSGSPAVLVGAVVGVLAIGALIALSSGGENPSPPAPTPVADAPATPGSQGAGSRGRGPESNVPVETAQQRADREKKEAEQARLGREEAALKALAGIEDWSRANWHGKSDDGAVIARYRNFAKEFKDTPAAATAAERVKGIESGKVHPHPDKSYGDADAIEAARVACTQAKPQLDGLIERHLYGEAAKLVPEAVEDAGGALAQDLRFWAQVTGHLSSFQLALAGATDAIPASQRKVKSKDGEAELKRIYLTDLEVRLDGKTERLPWTDVPPAELFRLASAAFAGKDAQHLVLLMAFAWAHRLSEEFWGVDLDLSSAPGAAAHSAAIGAYKRTWEERSASR
jgi:eukaryotic-like serine/threonine-protein kinase